LRRLGRLVRIGGRDRGGLLVLAEQTEGLQKAQTGVAQTSRKMSMKVNIQKTECRFLGAGSKKFHLEVNGQELEQTENFVYLGRNISMQEGSDKDVERRIGLARGTLQALGKMWSSKDLSKATKIRNACTRHWY